MSNRGVALRACRQHVLHWTSIAALALISVNGASAQERGLEPASVDDRIDAAVGERADRPRDNFAHITRPGSTEPLRQLPEPSIGGTPPTQAQVGKQYSFTPTSNDPGGAPLSFSIVNKPGWASFSISNGRLSGTPTSTGTTSGVAITASNGRRHAELAPFSIAVSGGSAAASVRLSASPSSIATGGATTLTWSSSGVSACTGSGGWSGNRATSGSASTGRLSSTTAYTLTCTGASGRSIATTTVTVASSSGGGGGVVARPSYNTGNGFFVSRGKLYDANGNEFRIRGVNRVHWDNNSAPGIAKSGANTERWLIDFTRTASDNVSLLQAQSIQNANVPIAGNWTGTCNSATSTLQSIISTWVSQAAAWTTLDRYLIVNIANEWGPSNSTVWRDSYINAIATLRSAGYLAPILVDSGGCGQDDQDLVNYSAAVFNSDPQKNVIFALHEYGGTNDMTAQIASIKKGNPTVVTLTSTSPTHPFAPTYNGTNNSFSTVSAYNLSGVLGMTPANGMQPAKQNVGGSPGAWTVTLTVDSTNWPAYTGGGTLVDYWGNYALKQQRLAQLSQQTGAVYIVGEFGPGQNIGPSPTMVTPGQIISAAEANGVGWLAWAWDDNDLAGGESDNNWFSMTYNGPGTYTQPSDLTEYGLDVVLNPTYGITALAKPASIFTH
jgi:hypothetical protein